MDVVMRFTIVYVTLAGFEASAYFGQNIDHTQRAIDEDGIDEYIIDLVRRQIKSQVINQIDRFLADRNIATIVSSLDLSDSSYPYPSKTGRPYNSDRQPYNTDSVQIIRNMAKMARRHTSYQHQPYEILNPPVTTNRQTDNTNAKLDTIHTNMLSVDKRRNRRCKDVIFSSFCKL